MESLKKIKINRPLLKEIRQTDNYAKQMKYLVENKPRTEEDNEIRMNPRCSALLQNHLPLKEQDLKSFIHPCYIRKLDFKNALANLGASISIMPFSMYKHLGIGKLEPINMLIEMADNTKCTPKGIRERFRDDEDDLEENLEDPEECGEDKENTILGVIHDKLNNDWFNNTSLETKVKTLANEVEGRINNRKFEECKTIYTKDGLPLYTPFYYSPEEIEYFSANSGFSDNERQETDDSGMAEALAELEATIKKKKEEPKREKQNVNYYVDPYEPPIPFLR
ncbi:hypothetical protein Tco_1113166 [Tanacetum coccineum]|uniref:Uncharacterized protein n=1 Tax=Tanacetum coccineum TaxID=301880 RepID=A0ABQ5IRE0_9ASTR